MKTVLLFDVLKAVVDNRGKTPPLSPRGFPLVEVKHIQNERLYPVLEDTKYVDRYTWNTWFRDHVVPGDVLFSTVGSIARTCIVPTSPRICIAQNVLAFRADDTKVDGRFLLYALRSSFFQQEVRARTIETVQKSIKVHDLKTCRIPLPSFCEQRLIVRVLGTIEDKIELNRCMNETLEAGGRAIFKSWFVGSDLQAGSRFGWQVASFGAVAGNPRDQVSPGDVPEATPYIGLEHMPRQSIALNEWGVAGEVGSNKFAFKAGDILFGKLRPYFHKVGIAAVDGVCSTDILVIRPKDPEWFAFALCHASSSEMVDFASAGSTGTKMPRTSWNELSRFEISLPSTPVARELNGKIQPLVQKIQANIHESRTLAEIRDALLPRLMSGELRIKEAARIIEAHA